jgi:hypothetical protein
MREISVVVRNLRTVNTRAEENPLQDTPDILPTSNRSPLTYVESDHGEEEILTPNVILWGQNAYTFKPDELDEDETSWVQKRLELARQHAWSRWRKEYTCMD